MSRTIIAGGRDRWLDADDFAVLDQLHAAHPITEVVCGMATGADCGGYFWSWWRLGRAPKAFPYLGALGRAGGPVRNAQMAEYADALILFPGGRGAASMLREATKRGLRIHRPDRSWIR
jgi:hypothetical protein